MAYQTVGQDYDVKKGDILLLRYNVAYIPNFFPTQEIIAAKIETMDNLRLITSGQGDTPDELVLMCRAISDNTPVFVIVAAVASVLVSLFLWLTFKDVRVSVPFGGSFESTSSISGSIIALFIILIAAYFFILRK